MFLLGTPWLQLEDLKAILSWRVSVVALCGEHASDLGSERCCCCSHAIKARDLMRTGWGEYRLAVLECQPLSWLQKSARSRSHRGTHVCIYACEVMEEIKHAYYPRLVCLSDSVMHDTAPTLNPVLGACMQRTPKNIVFIPPRL